MNKSELGKEEWSGNFMCVVFQERKKLFLKYCNEFIEFIGYKM